ncbi:MAG TPA: hypothetical protein PKC98_19925 [Candidatus Melainabacteria bacterium]|nr:hypothetical protein [Candidatus Melainabacteria bacterium]
MTRGREQFALDHDNADSRLKLLAFEIQLCTMEQRKSNLHAVILY